MDIFAELFKSQIGILATLTIALVIVIAVTMFFCVKKQAGLEDHNQK